MTLPPGWISAPLSDLGEWQGGGTPSKSNPDYWRDGDIPWVSPKDMKTKVVVDAEDRITALAVARSSTQMVQAGSILIVTRSGILKHSLPVATNAVSVAINQDLKALTPADGVDATYVVQALSAQAQQILGSCSKAGTTVDSIDFERLKAWRIPLAPFAEQRRIVAKLDELLGCTARARKELDRVPKLVAQHKRAILRAAFTGALTEDWRRGRGHSESWPMATVGQTSLDISYGTSAKSANLGDVPVLRMGNIQDGRLDWSKLVYTSDKEEITKYSLRPGDVLFNRTNSPELVGKTALYGGERPAVFAGYLIRVRCKEALLPSLLTHFLNSPAGREYCWQVKSDGVSQSNINAAKLAAFSFGLPPPEEQGEIVRRIDGAFAWIERLAQEHARADHLLPRLEQALLAKAFRGELVPQDPNDEPASLLLERIRAERAAEPPRARRPRAGLSSTPRAPRRQTAMTKSRQDPDVKLKPYLATHLRSAGGSAKVEDLFRRADLPVADFYKQLAWEVEAGHVREQGPLLEAA